jgi:hypothetical protein
MMVTSTEAGFVDYAAELGITDISAVLKFVHSTVGDVNRPPVMWMLENPARHEYGHTTYPAVADAYRLRPGYTVTAIYPRAPLP